MSQQMHPSRLRPSRSSALAPAPAALPGAPPVHGLVSIDDDGIIIGWSDGAVALLGWSAADIVGRSHACLFVAADRERRVAETLLAEARLRKIVSETCWCSRKDGSRFWASSILLSHTTATGPGFLRILQDLTDRDDAVARALLHSEAQFRLLTETIPQLVWRSRDDGRWDWAGPQWVAYTGQPEAESHRLGWIAMVHPDDRPATLQAWDDALMRGGLDVEHRIRRADGVYRWFQTRAVPLQDTEDANVPRRWFGSSTDVHNLREAEQRIQFLALHDVLTGAANRALLQQELDRITSRAPSQPDPPAALLFLDLDRFKRVNDQLGHPGGDALLRQVVARLQACAGEGGTVARTGGDEFVLVQPGAGPDAAAGIAAAIAAALSASFVIDGQTLQIGVGIGIACYPRDGRVPEELLRRADMALRHAKAAGEAVRFFEPELEQAARRRQALERDLVQAVEAGALDVHYQPVFRTGTGALCGFEALARWSHPERGPVPPDVFIPIAEECGLIVRIGEWVLDRACREAVGWRDGLFVAVNLSPAQFRTGDVPQRVAATLARTGLPAARLELEVTEGLLMERSEQVLGALREIRALGVGLALDDFGTGYSSLGYLCSFPFSKLKIDRSFVRDIETDTGACAVIEAVTALAHGLHLQVSAEGVETEAQLALLRGIGCDHVQGYLLGRPAPAPVLDPAG